MPAVARAHPAASPAPSAKASPWNPYPANARQLARLLAAAQADLVRQLEPLPAAIGEIATALHGHACMDRQRHEELTRAVDALQQRTWDLFVAVSKFSGAHERRAATRTQEDRR